MKLENGLLSEVGADGALVGIPGFANGYVTVGNVKIRLSGDRPPIIMRSGVMSVSVTGGSLVGDTFFPFKLLLIGLKAIITTTVDVAYLTFGNSATQTAYLNGMTIGTTAGNITAAQVVDLFPSVVGYNATSATGIVIPANTRLSFGNGTAGSVGAVNMTAILVPHI